MSKNYSVETEERMRAFYESLNEKDRRRYAGMEALRFGHGGRSYIARVLGCSRNTVSKGASEVSGLSSLKVAGRICKEKDKKRRTVNGHRIRRKGGGRKKYYVKLGEAELDRKFMKVLRDHTAGDPMDEQIRWTNLTQLQIAKVLQEDHGIVVSTTVIRQLLAKHNYRRRKAQKRLGLKKDIENRDEQFENIARLKAIYEAAGNPMISLDTKKRIYRQFVS